MQFQRRRPTCFATEIRTPSPLTKDYSCVPIVLKYHRKMIEVFGRSFVKALPSPLKSRAAALHPCHFATLLQNYESF